MAGLVLFFLLLCSQCPAQTPAAPTVESVSTRHVDALLGKRFFLFESHTAQTCGDVEQMSVSATGTVNMDGWSHYTSRITAGSGRTGEVTTEFYVRDDIAFSITRSASPQYGQGADTAFPEWEHVDDAVFRSRIPLSPLHTLTALIEDKTPLEPRGGKSLSSNVSCDLLAAMWSQPGVSGALEVCVVKDTGLAAETRAVLQFKQNGAVCETRATTTLLPQAGPGRVLPPEPVLALYQRQSGAVAVDESAQKASQDPGPCQGSIEPLSTEEYTQAQGLPPGPAADLMATADGSVWLATGQGLVQVKNGRVDLHTAGGKLIGLTVSDLARSNDGYIRVATSAGVFSYDGSRWDLMTKAQGLPDNFITCLAVPQSGNELWAGTMSGAAIYRGGWQIFNEDHVLGKAHISTMHAAADGAIWVAANTGIFRYKDKQFDTMHDPDAPGGWDVFSFTSTANGVLWAATADGIMRHNGDRWLNGPDLPQEYGVAPAALAASGDGCVYAGVAGTSSQPGALLRFDGVIWTAWSRDDGLNGVEVSHIAPAPDGSLWIATDLGLQHLIFK